MSAYYVNWLEEKRSAYLYHVMSQYEKIPLHKNLFANLEKAAEAQAAIWGEKIKSQDASIALKYQTDIRTKIIVLLIKFIGSHKIYNILSAMKIRGMSVFRNYHNEHQHTTLNASSNLRAAVFGINDGLISNMSLILGIAGANANQHIIILTGIAGLIAGACSMAAGEYISVKSQREVFEYQIAIEREELQEYPEEEAEELALIYQARGVPEKDANHLANLLIANPETSLNTLAREELGLNPEDLVSPLGAMLASFFSFTFGAIIPLLAFFFSTGTNALMISIASTAFTLIGIGMTLSLFTNQPALKSGVRMLLIGTIAGIITYSIGHLLGVTAF